MKKLFVILLFLAPLVCQAQIRRYQTGSITTAKDTIVKINVGADVAWSWSVDLTAATGADGIVTLVVCNSPGGSVATAPVDAKFIPLATNMADTLASTGTYLFSDVSLNYDWVGLKFEKKTCTSWTLTHKLIYDSK